MTCLDVNPHWSIGEMSGQATPRSWTSDSRTVRSSQNFILNFILSIVLDVFDIALGLIPGIIHDANLNIILDILFSSITIVLNTLLILLGSTLPSLLARRLPHPPLLPLPSPQPGLPLLRPRPKLDHDPPRLGEPHDLRPRRLDHGPTAESGADIPLPRLLLQLLVAGRDAVLGQSAHVCAEPAPGQGGPSRGFPEQSRRGGLSTCANGP